MAVYKVPQDVEAEDKLLGPFSFRQFVYLIIAGAAAFIGWLMWNITPFMVLIPAPIVVFFVILALPLRKDQPMEIYLIALVQYLLKPKRRLWEPDGIISHIQLTIPQVAEIQRTKDLTENEAVDRLSYLAQVMDTRGWASRGVGEQPPVATATPSVPNDTSMNDTVVAEARAAEDILDTGTHVSRSFDSLLQRQDASRRQDMMTRMQQVTGTTSQPAPAAPSPVAHIPNNPYDTFTQGPAAPPTDEPAADTSDTPSVHYNPYPTAIRQQVIQPYDHKPEAPPMPVVPPPAAPPLPRPDHATQQNASKIEVSPDIIGLANNPDFSISTIAHEAKRIQERQQDEGEVVIPLR